MLVVLETHIEPFLDRSLRGVLQLKNIARDSLAIRTLRWTSEKPWLNFRQNATSRNKTVLLGVISKHNTKMAGEMREKIGNVVPKNEFLSFRLGGEEYGLDIQRVQEIRGYEAVTPVPGAPIFIKGLVNLRGAIVPIVDLRIKLGFGDGTYDDQTVVIILGIAERIVGVVVDGVTDVLTLSDEQIKSVPDMGSTIESDYVMGLVSSEDRMVILVDIEKMMTSRELGLEISAAGA